MKYFTTCKTLDELKAAYRKLALRYHPDHGGDTATMQAINNEYSEMHNRLKDAHNASADEKHQTTETPDEFIKIVSVLMKMNGLEVELCGRWLWIGGNTKEHKDALKAAGCRWSNNKKMWYWRHDEDGYTFSRGRYQMSEIRNKYGSQKVGADGSYSEYQRERIGA